MVKGTTSTGFEFEYDPRRLDDMRFVDVLAVAIDPDRDHFDTISALSKLTDMLLGKELKERLYAHIGASNDGRVPQLELQQALTEIMSAAGKDAEKN